MTSWRKFIYIYLKNNNSFNELIGTGPADFPLTDGLVPVLIHTELWVDTWISLDCQISFVGSHRWHGVKHNYIIVYTAVAVQGVILAVIFI